MATCLSFAHLCTSSGLLLGSWLHLWMTWIPMPLADAGCKTQTRRDQIFSLQVQWDRRLLCSVLTGFTIHFWRLAPSSHAFLSNLMSWGRMKDWGKKLNSFFPQRDCIFNRLRHRRSFLPI